MDIELLVEDIKNGDMDRFKDLIKLYEKQLFTYIYHMINNRQEAEDILQDVFVIVYERISKYNYSKSFTAWIYKIAYNKTINQLKRRNAIKIINYFDFKGLVNHKDNNENDFDSPFNHVTEKTLNKLSFEEKNILFLRVFEEKSYEEIGVILDKKPATLRKKYERIRKKFKKYYLEISRRDVDEGYGVGSKEIL